MPELTFREAVRDAMSEAMRRDDDVFIMGEDIAEMGGSMGVTQGMLDEFGPDRVRNTPISEAAIVGTGIGAAIQGMRPIVEIMYQDFTTLAMEQLVNQAAKHRTMSGGQLSVPLTIRTQGGAGWSPGAQHAQQLEAWFVHVPGLKVAEEAEKDGISVEVVDPRTLQPLDEETIVGSVQKTTRCVTAHEAVTRGGFGAELAAVIQHGALDWLDAPN